MRNLSSIAWRNLVSRRLRSLLSVVGIALGVALLLAALAVDGGIEQAIERLSSDQLGRATLRLTAFEPSGLSTVTLARLRGFHFVAAVAPRVEGTAIPSAGDRTNLGALEIVGVDPVSETQVHDYPVQSGVFLGADTGASVVLPADWARARGLSVGDFLSIPGSATRSAFRVIGLFEASGQAGQAGGAIAFVDIEAAQRLFGMTGRFTRADIMLAEGADLAAAEEAIETAASGEHYALTPASEISAALRSQVADFRATTTLLAALALFVAGFLIYNTLSTAVRERVREIGLLRIAGATRRQVYGLVIVEGLLLGAAGAALGVALGVIAAEAMARYVQANAAAPLDGAVIAPRVLAIVFTAGILVTVAAALRPAARAARVSPVEALRSRAEQRTRLDPRRAWIAALNGALLVALLSFWPLVLDTASVATLAKACLVFALLVVTVSVAPPVFAALSRVAAVPFTRFLPAEGRVARGAILRDRGRSAVTMGALMVGLTAVVAIAMFAFNARRTGDTWLASTIPGDAVVRPLAPAALADGGRLRFVRGVAGVTPVRTFKVDLAGRGVEAAAIEPLAFEAAGALDFVQGDRTHAFTALADGGAVLVPESEAGVLGIELGSSVAIRTSAGERTFEVAGIVARSFPGSDSQAILVGWKDAREVFGYRDANLFIVRAKPDTTAAALAEALRRTAGPENVQVYTLADLSRAVAGQLGRVFGFFDALALVALLVATLGIANTLTMSIHERIREFGILRATGMSRRGIRRMVLVEGWLIGLVGGTLGALGGIAVGAVILVFARSDAFVPPLEIPWAFIAWGLFLGLLASVVAAYYPARAAERIPIASAVRQF